MFCSTTHSGSMRDPIDTLGRIPGIASSEPYPPMTPAGVHSTGHTRASSPSVRASTTDRLGPCAETDRTRRAAIAEVLKPLRPDR